MSFFCSKATEKSELLQKNDYMQSNTAGSMLEESVGASWIESWTASLETPRPFFKIISPFFTLFFQAGSRLIKSERLPTNFGGSSRLCGNFEES